MSMAVTTKLFLTKLTTTNALWRLCQFYSANCYIYRTKVAQSGLSVTQALYVPSNNGGRIPPPFGSLAVGKGARLPR